MAEPTPIGNRLRDFEDLASQSDEVLRHIASRVHVVDLAYAFGTADEELLKRLLGSVRPGLAEQIQSNIKTVEAAADRFPPEDQVRTARAKVMEVARMEVMLEEEQK